MIVQGFFAILGFDKHQKIYDRAVDKDELRWSLCLTQWVKASLRCWNFMCPVFGPPTEPTNICTMHVVGAPVERDFLWNRARQNSLSQYLWWYNVRWQLKNCHCCVIFYLLHWDLSVHFQGSIASLSALDLFDFGKNRGKPTVGNGCWAAMQWPVMDAPSYYDALSQLANRTIYVFYLCKIHSKIMTVAKREREYNQDNILCTITDMLKNQKYFEMTHWNTFLAVFA